MVTCQSAPADAKRLPTGQRLNGGATSTETAAVRDGTYSDARTVALGMDDLSTADVEGNVIAGVAAVARVEDKIARLQLRG